MIFLSSFFFHFQVLYDPIFFRGDLVSSTGNARLIIWNDTVYLEDAFRGFSPEVLNNFRKDYEPEFQLLRLPYASVNSIEKNLDVVLAVKVKFFSFNVIYFCDCDQISNKKSFQYNTLVYIFIWVVYLVCFWNFWVQKQAKLFLKL